MSETAKRIRVPWPVLFLVFREIGRLRHSQHPQRYTLTPNTYASQRVREVMERRSKGSPLVYVPLAILPEVKAIIKAHQKILKGETK